MENHRNRISGPLLDRIDIHIEAPAVEVRDLSSEERAEPSAAIRARVVEVRKMHQSRFSGPSKTRANSGMSHSQIKAHCKLDSTGQDVLRTAMEDLQFSARAYDRILKVSRSIADLAAAEPFLSSRL